jgi:probable rRNA maturation factor
MSSDGSCILFQVPARGLARLELRAFANRLQRQVAAEKPFNALIANDAELRRLNKQFRKKDYAADVLSFPSIEPEKNLGELAISWDRAKAQASEYGHTVSDEIRILMLHGVLHLIGMDHEKDHGEMARAEIRWRKRLSLPTSLIERVRS